VTSRRREFERRAVREMARQKKFVEGRGGVGGGKASDRKRKNRQREGKEAGGTTIALSLCIVTVAHDLSNESFKQSCSLFLISSSIRIPHRSQ